VKRPSKGDSLFAEQLLATSEMRLKLIRQRSELEKKFDHEGMSKKKPASLPMRLRRCMDED
jgi:hypothetical protein